ncbi:MAG: pilus assembly protein [Acidimicrobiia bacterium]|nr:pilus assembly protein [Acidimicrobiia bacterium]
MNRSRVSRRLVDDQGGSAYAAIEMVLVIGLILLPTLAGLAQIPRWVEAKSTADLAAQEAARHMVLADSWEEATVAAEAVVAAVVDNRGLDVGALGAITYVGSLDRGASITVTVTLQVPPVVLPGFGPVGGTIDLSRSATERVDDYREFG